MLQIIQNARHILPGRLLRFHSRQLSSTLLKLSEVQDYSVEEVRIPVPVPGNAEQNYIAGRLFRGTAGEDSPKYPPIICLHGWGDTLASFDPLLPHIVGGRNITALSFDMTGHGKSPHPPGPYVDLHLETRLTILRLIRHYKWDKVTLMGHSFGGPVSLSFATIFPDLMHSFVGLDILIPRLAFLLYERKTFNHLETKVVMERTLEIEQKVASGRPSPEYTRQEMIERMMKGRAMQGGSFPDICDMLVDRGSNVQPNGKLVFSNDPRWNNFFYTGLLSLGSNMDTFTKNIHCPTCLINMLPQQTDEELGSDIVKHKTKINDFEDDIRKTASKLVTANVNIYHHGHICNPEVVSPIINSFLKSNL